MIKSIISIGWISDMSQKSNDSNKSGIMIVVAGFDSTKESSVFYRKYKKPCSAAKNIQKIIGLNKVDYISIRILNRPKVISLDEFVPNVVVELEKELPPLNDSGSFKEDKK